VLTAQKETTLPHPITPARKLAESLFKKASVPVALADYELHAQRQRQLTAQLRVLRLAKEQADMCSRRNRPISTA
jgi:hypothetical protein